MRQATSPGGLFGEPPRPKTRTPLIIVVALAVLALAVVGFFVVRRQGGASRAKGETVPSFTIAPAAPTTVDPQQAVEAAVIHDYLAHWAAYDDATGAPDGHPPNPSLPALATYITGGNLTHVKQYIIGMKAEGLTALGTSDNHPHAIRIDGDTAVIDDCYTDNGHLVDVSTHALRDKPGPATRGVEATLERDSASGIWKTANVVDKAGVCPPS